MRKRIKAKQLVAKATTNWFVSLETKQKVLKPFVRIFGDWKEIQPSDLPMYKDFKIKWE